MGQLSGDTGTASQRLQQAVGDGNVAGHRCGWLGWLVENWDGGVGLEVLWLAVVAVVAVVVGTSAGSY